MNSDLIIKIKIKILNCNVNQFKNQLNKIVSIIDVLLFNKYPKSN